MTPRVSTSSHRLHWWVLWPRPVTGARGLAALVNGCMVGLFAAMPGLGPARVDAWRDLLVLGHQP